MTSANRIRSSHPVMLRAAEASPVATSIGMLHWRRVLACGLAARPGWLREVAWPFDPLSMTSSPFCSTLPSCHAEAAEASPARMYKGMLHWRRLLACGLAVRPSWRREVPWPFDPLSMTRANRIRSSHPVMLRPPKHPPLACQRGCFTGIGCDLALWLIENVVRAKDVGRLTRSA